MPKLKLFALLFFCTGFLLLFTFPTNVLAVSSACQINLLSGISDGYITGSLIKDIPPNFKGNITIESNGDCFVADREYQIYAVAKGGSISSSVSSQGFFQKPLSGDLRHINILLDLTAQNRGQSHPGNWEVLVCDIPPRSAQFSPSDCGKTEHIITTTSFNVGLPVPTPTLIPPQTLPKIDVASQKQCLFQAGKPVVINKITNILSSTTRSSTTGDITYNSDYHWWWDGDRDFTKFYTTTVNGPTELVNQLTIEGSKTTNLSGEKKLCIDLIPQSRNNFGDNCIPLTFQVRPLEPDQQTKCSPTTRGVSNECTQEMTNKCQALGKEKNVPYICKGGQCIQQTTSAGFSCNPNDPKIVGGVPQNPGDGIWTAIGCVPTEPTALIQGILKFAVGAGGGIALLLMVFGAFQMITSAGNPEGVKKGHEMMTSAVIGLLFIIFSTLLLKVIGVDILNIPGFSP